MAETDSFDDVVTVLDQHKWVVQDGDIVNAKGERLSMLQVLTRVLLSPVAIVAVEPELKLDDSATSGKVWRVRIDSFGVLVFTKDVGAFSGSLKVHHAAVDNLFTVGVQGPSRCDVTGKLFINSVEVIPDFAFSDEFVVPSIDDHSAQAKEMGHLPNVPKATKSKDDQGQDTDLDELDVSAHVTGMLLETEIAHFHTKDLSDQAKERDKKIATLEARILSLEGG